MADNQNEKKYPFTLKLYQNKIPELILENNVGNGHQALKSIITLLQKFPLLFLEIPEGASLKAEVKEFFQVLPNPEKVFIITAQRERVEFDPYPIPVLPTLQSALMRMKHKPAIEATAKKIGMMPLMRVPVFEYLDMLKDETLTFETISKALKNNDNLCQHILTICNSMERFIKNPFTDISRALPFIGIEGVRQMLIEEAFTMLTRIFVNQKERLIHMRRVSHIAGVMGTIMDSNTPHMMWRMRSAGLLHDVGSLVLGLYNKADAENCIHIARQQKITICEAENQVFGYNHQEAGRHMADIMNLPDYLYQSITKHHEMYYPTDDALLCATRIANNYINTKSEKLAATPSDDCLEYLEASKQVLETEKKEKEAKRIVREKERRLARLDPNDIEGRQRIEEEFARKISREHGIETPEETEEEKERRLKHEAIMSTEEGEEPEFGSRSSLPEFFDMVDLEVQFREKLTKVLIDGFTLPNF